MSVWSNSQVITENLSELIHHYAQLGLWILTEKEEYLEAKNRYHADIIETDGRLKPSEVSFIEDHGEKYVSGITELRKFAGEDET